MHKYGFDELNEIDRDRQETIFFKNEERIDYTEIQKKHIKGRNGAIP